MKKMIYFNCTVLTLLLFILSSCNKDTNPGTTDTNSSANLSSGRAGIMFNTDIDFGGSKTFKIINTALTMSTTQLIGSTKRYMVMRAEETYGGLADTRKATVYITVPVPVTTPVIIDLSVPMSSVPSAQVELYYTIGGGSFGNTYRTLSGELRITKLTDTEIEGSFSGSAIGSISPNYVLTNGSFAGKF